MTSDIVEAEVVEVERPKRPELFCCGYVSREGNCYISPCYSTSEKAREYYSNIDGVFIVRIPAAAPAAATRGADAVEIEAAFRQMAENAAYYNGQGREMDGKFLNDRPLWESYLTPKAREILAALKGA